MKLPFTIRSVPIQANFDALVKAIENLTVGAGGPPSGPAGGVLSGTYPNPGFAADMATQAELDAHIAQTIAGGAHGGGGGGSATTFVGMAKWGTD